MLIAVTLVLTLFFIAIFLNPVALVGQGSVGVVTQFGKFERVMQPGFNLKWPWERVHRLNLQTNALELKFKAITLDQANAMFNCTVLYEVEGDKEGSIERAMYAFASYRDFTLSLERLVEDETRAYVASKHQAELISISQDVAGRIKVHLDASMRAWGYRVVDLRYSDLQFDEEIKRSMARVVAALNERDAAENEGKALLIRKVKEAEAHGEYVRIAAAAECEAWKLRGIGLAEFRREVAKGIHDAVGELQSAGVDPNYMLFFIYTEALKHIAENSSAGNTMFISSHPGAPQAVLEDLAAFCRVAPAGHGA